MSRTKAHTVKMDRHYSSNQPRNHTGWHMSQPNRSGPRALNGLSTSGPNFFQRHPTHNMHPTRMSHSTQNYRPNQRPQVQTTKTTTHTTTYPAQTTRAMHNGQQGQFNQHRHQFQHNPNHHGGYFHGPNRMTRGVMASAPAGYQGNYHSRPGQYHQRPRVHFH